MSGKEAVVAIIGAGSLGRRHLESLSLCEHPLSVCVVDPSKEMMKLSTEVVGYYNKPIKCDYFESIGSLPSNVDIAIVATTATVRFEVFSQLLGKKVRNIVLEKVAFNSVSDIQSAIEKYRAYSSEAWINCPRRMYDVYDKVKEIIGEDEVLKFQVVGDEYGLACNGIHFIDLFSYLSGSAGYTFISHDIDQIVESKRKGYVEFYGSVIGKFENGSCFELKCNKGKAGASYLIVIELSDRKIVINELDGKCKVVRYNKKGIESFEFQMPYQSLLTGPLVDQIVKGQGCKLTSFYESMMIHYTFVEFAYEVYSEKYGVNERKMVPIT